MKKWLSCLIYITIAPMLLFGFADDSVAKKRSLLAGAGWNYPVPFDPGNQEFDEKLYDQDVIESYGHNAKSVDEIKDLLPSAMYIIMKNPQDWGPKRINVTPYIPFSGEIYDRYKEATEKYKGTAKLDEDGRLINYTAGCPFPEPKNGLEALWNMKRRLHEDDRIMMAVMLITNRKRQIRIQEANGDLIFMDGRLGTPGQYKLTPNPKGFFRIDVFATKQPYELQGTLSVISQYVDPTKQDDFWVYLPAMRRVRRLSAAQRTDRLPGGADLMWENFDTFNGNPLNYSCKLLGQKEMLVGHNARPESEWVKGDHLSGVNDFWQKVNVYVIEMTPKDPNFPFSKVILYTDPDNWEPYFTEWFDKAGKIYMFSDFRYTPTKVGLPFPATMNHVDIQTIHSTGHLTSGPYYNMGLTPDHFKVNNLKRLYPAR